MAEEASAANDNDALRDALINITTVPMKLLAVPRGGKRNRRSNINAVLQNIEDHLAEQSGRTTAEHDHGPATLGINTKASETRDLTMSEKALLPSVRRLLP